MISNVTQNYTLASVLTFVRSAIANLHVVMPLLDTVKDKEAALEEEQVWEALEEMMIMTAPMPEMATILEWMESCIRMGRHQIVK